MSRLISSRSLSSASTVRPMPAAAAALARLPSRSVELGDAGGRVRRLVARVERRQLDRDRMAVRGVRRADRAGSRRHSCRNSAAASALVRAASPSMSKLAVKPALSLSAARSSASSMVRPMTKICPIIRIAAPTAVRTNGSPERAISRRSTEARSELPTTARVSTSPQVAELTSAESLLPACAPQSAVPILSRIRRSAVAASGTRRNASASDSSATPSAVLSRYCWRKRLTQPDPCAARRSASRPSARSSTRARTAASSVAAGSSCASTWGSGARWRSRRAARAAARLVMRCPYPRRRGPSRDHARAAGARRRLTPASPRFKAVGKAGETP